ncbi:nucleotide exchange factor GrpE [Streptomyces albipurpureus]|uniref:Protein GrpE n=1 Tax=Streptomyces albipurpureus TaxID=2897419 RepID=A0ABT0USI1_9ACTN|nr:nucleotide exchange factor GrpE [Streptomyces sp. CWNU-1]MCM2391307.1 nucleotide exchange factor GrpE [Streptomyces sp. CWNU-1]
MTEETPGFDKHGEHDAQDKHEVNDPSEANADGAASDGAASDGAATEGAASDESSAKEDKSALSGDAAKVTSLTAQLDQARTALSERTGDLQRLQAEYQNYRRRVDRDRITVKEIATASLLTELLPVLDDIGRAREHGELVGGFKSVAESLETSVAKLGLQQFGKEGEPFDPTIHEALMHSYAPDVTETTCVAVLQPGYRIGERTIRPARVAVAEPQPGAAAGSSGKDEATDDEESGGPDEG